MKDVKRFLKMEYLEDGKIIWILLEVILLALAFVLQTNPANRLALLIAGMYIGAYIVSSFHHRTGAETLLLGSGAYRQKRGWLLAISCFIHNLLLEAGIYLYLMILFPPDLIVILYGTVLCLFTNAVGMLVGSTAKSEIVGLAVILFLVSINFMKMLLHEENLRFFSPIVQVGNMNTLQWWNLSGLLVLAVTIFAVIIFRKKMLILAGITGMFLIIAADIRLNDKTSPVRPEYDRYAGDILDRINEINAQCGMIHYDDIVIYKSVYYPWEPAQEKRVFYERDNILYMNCFTEYLCNLEEREIVSRWAISELDEDTGLQTAMTGMYISYILGDMEVVEQFTSERQTKMFGSVVYEDLGIASDTLLKQKEDYGQLYRLAKEYQDDERVMKLWQERSGNQ